MIHTYEIPDCPLCGTELRRKARMDPPEGLHPIGKKMSWYECPKCGYKTAECDCYTDVLAVALMEVKEYALTHDCKDCTNCGEKTSGYDSFMDALNCAMREAREHEG